MIKNYFNSFNSFLAEEMLNNSRSLNNYKNKKKYNEKSIKQK